MSLVTLSTLKSYKNTATAFSGLSLYDASFAALASDAGIDFILIGDSLGACVQGHPSTLPVTLDDILYHLRCVQRGNTRCFLIADMPFMTFATVEQTLQNAAHLMRAGAHMVKVEGGTVVCPQVQALSLAGIPVCGHIGLMPQYCYQQGGYKVQGKTLEAQTRLLSEAQALVDAGVQLLVLECVPSALAADITRAVSVPVIGIGAGVATDGQILVAYDCLGMSSSRPKFVKNFLKSETSILEAFRSYANQVRERAFPTQEYAYGD